MIYDAKYVGKLDIKPCPNCLKKGITTYIPITEEYCPYCKREVREKEKAEPYPIRKRYYLDFW